MKFWGNISHTRTARRLFHSAESLELMLMDNLSAILNWQKGTEMELLQKPWGLCHIRPKLSMELWKMQLGMDQKVCRIFFMGRLRHFLWGGYEFLVEILALEYLTIFFNSITEMKSFSKNSELFSVQILATAVISKLSSEFCYFW